MERHCEMKIANAPALRSVLYRLFALLAIVFVVPAAAFAAPSKTTASKVKPAKKAPSTWIRLHVLRAEIWPRTAKDDCWDPCGWSRPKLPVRQLYPYSWYLKNKVFREAVKGWKAPDVRLLFKIGQQTHTTPVLKDTTQPVWKFSKILAVKRTDSWRFKLLDDDSWGDQVIGQYSQKTLPSVFFTGGVLTMRKIGQIELLQLRVEKLKPGEAKTLASKTTPRKRAAQKPKAAKRGVSVKKPLRALPPRRRAIPRPVVSRPVVRRPPQRRSIAPRIVRPKSISVRKRPVRRVPVIVRKPVAKRRALPLRSAVVKRTAVKPRNADVGPMRLVRIDVKGAWLWPTKKGGNCWDLCWGKASGMPPRGMPFFQNYFQQKAFKSVAKGRSAPDPWLRVRIGQRVWTTAVQNDTVTPRWKLSLLARIGPNTPIQFALHDKDTFSSEMMGSWKAKGMPARWKQGGLLRLGSFGQVEDVAIKVTTLNRVEKKNAIVQTTQALPAHVRFVKVTVVKARLWPQTAAKKCWDTCTSWSQPKLPPRGLSQFDVYMKHEGFRSIATGRAAPDPRVKVQIGKYDMYITPTKNNTVKPVWNASHVFRLRGNEAMTITVSDDDQNVAHDLLRTYRSTRELMDRWAKEEIGRYHMRRLPIQMIKGGRLILRSFGQVEYLELKIEPLPVRNVRKGCEGVYRVRIAEMDIQKTRADGRPWHAGVGRMSRPSPYVRLWLGPQKIESPVAYKRLNAIYQTSRIIPIRKDTTMSIEVSDFNVGFRLSFDRQIKVPFVPLRIGIGMKNEPASQSIGQTAFFSVCPLIRQSNHGVVTLKPFGRVKKVLLFFDKIS